MSNLRGQGKMAWKALDLNQGIVDACMIMSGTARKESSRNYWEGAADFIASLEHKPYVHLSVKQRNWAHTIKSDLKSEGMI